MTVKLIPLKLEFSDYYHKYVIELFEKYEEDDIFQKGEPETGYCISKTWNQDRSSMRGVALMNGRYFLDSNMKWTDDLYSDHKMFDNIDQVEKYIESVTIKESAF